nr:hypothetical protein [Arthrobacter sp. ZGTC412]
MSDPFEARDDRSAVRMPKNNWHPQAAIDYLLYGCSVRSQRAPVQTRNMYIRASMAQILHQSVEVGRLMP